MKKLFSAVLSVLFCALLSWSVLASDGNLTLKALQEKDEIALYINISENSQLCTTEFYVNFPSDSLEFKQGSEAVGNAAAELSPYITANTLSDGVLKISYTCTEALVNGGEICKVSFKPKKDATVHFAPEIEHAETFDGEHILSLDFSAEGCAVPVTKPAPNTAIIIFSALAAAAAVIIITLIKKRKV